MKGITLIVLGFLLAGCQTMTTEIVEYRQVIVAPVVEPVILSTELEPIDVTTTTIDFY